MNKKLLVLGIILFIISLLLIFFPFTYKSKLITFNCDSNCSASPGVSYQAKLNEIDRVLRINKTGKGAFYPYMDYSLKDESPNFVETSKYNKNINDRVRLTKSEVESIKKLIKLSENSKYKEDVLVLLLDMIYNNNDFCLNDKACYNYYKNSDSNNDNKITYREKGDFLLNKYINYIKENDNSSEVSKKIDLSLFNCKLDNNSCTKTINSIYNNKKNTIKIKYYYKLEENNVSMHYEIYLNDKRIDEFKNTEYTISNKEELKDMLNFGGYLLIVDNKYLAFMHYKYIDINNSKLMLNVYGENKIDNNLVLPNNLNINDIEINGNVLNIWYPICKKNKFIQLNLEFNQEGLLVKTDKNKQTDKLNKTFDLEDFGVCYEIEKNKIIEN